MNLTEAYRNIYPRHIRLWWKLHYIFLPQKNQFCKLLFVDLPFTLKNRFTATAKHHAIA